ncbi:MAG: hypothetical protein ACXWV9_07130 [Flavisolibacter sp.]
MKKLFNHKTFSLLVCFMLTITLKAQEAEKPELLVNLGYYTSNNSIQYLQVKTMIKADNKLQPVKDVVVQLYLDSISPENLISKVSTNEKGIAKAGVPVSLKNKWETNRTHKFIAVTVATSKEEETITEMEVGRAKIVIDTANTDGTRSVTLEVLSLENGEWVPAKEVEAKIGVRRLGGEIKIGEEESYTTDSLGQINAEFKIDSLPAIDTKGNIVIVAKIEDNELFGNVMMEKTIPWGKYYTRESIVGQRSLWATRDRTPVWLLLMAYSIIGLVWGVIIYLVFQLIKIKKLGKEASGSTGETIPHTEALLID